MAFAPSKVPRQKVLRTLENAVNSRANRHSDRNSLMPRMVNGARELNNGLASVTIPRVNPR